MQNGDFPSFFPPITIVILGSAREPKVTSHLIPQISPKWPNPLFCQKGGNLDISPFLPFLTRRTLKSHEFLHFSGEIDSAVTLFGQKQAKSRRLTVGRLPLLTVLTFFAPETGISSLGGDSQTPTYCSEKHKRDFIGIFFLCVREFGARDSISGSSEQKSGFSVGPGPCPPDGPGPGP